MLQKAPKIQNTVKMLLQLDLRGDAYSRQLLAIVASVSTTYNT